MRCCGRFMTSGMGDSPLSVVRSLLEIRVLSGPIHNGQLTTDN